MDLDAQEYVKAIGRTYAKIAALCGFAGLGVWLAARRTRDDDVEGQQAGSDPTIERFHGLIPVDIDDDAAAEVIRRALPALERARAVALTDHQR